MSSNVIKVFLRNGLDVRLGVKLRKLKSLNRLNDGEKNLIFGLYRQLRYRIRLIKIDDRRKIKFSRCSIFFFFFFCKYQSNFEGTNCSSNKFEIVSQ